MNEGKLRLTKQRQIILAELRKVTSHPTADDLYNMVRQRLPKISLGTVYRNLEILSDNGIIQKLDVGGTQKRFDGNAAPHYHIRCASCGRVDDLHLPPDESVEEKAAKLTNFKIIRHHLEFVGYCPSCNGGAKSARF